MIDFATASANFQYLPETGEIVRLSGPKAGKVVGYKKTRGYVQVSYANKHLHAHRLAWLLAHGELPEGVIDHIDGNTANNKLSNLRCVSRSTNLGNIHKPQSSSTTGYRGVSRAGERFRAALKINGRSIHVGTFDSAEQAHAAYVAEKRRLMGDLPPLPFNEEPSSLPLCRTSAILACG